MPAASSNLFSPAIAFVVRKELGDAIHLGERRIVRMQSQLHPSFLGNGQDRFEEVGVMRPDIFSRVFPLELLLLDSLSKVFSAELPSQVAAPFHLVRRVGIRRMEVVRGNRDSQSSQIAKEVPIGFDVLITTRLAQLDLE
jgi:hypothetical protein